MHSGDGAAAARGLGAAGFSHQTPEGPCAAGASAATWGHRRPASQRPAPSTACAAANQGRAETGVAPD